MQIQIILISTFGENSMYLQLFFLEFQQKNKIDFVKN